MPRDISDRGARPAKPGYSANGLTRASVEAIVEDTERTFTGTTAHPWPAELKRAMVEACNGATQPGDVKERIDKLRLEYEMLVTNTEKVARALARAGQTKRRRRSLFGKRGS
jgi:Tfp pilus assembly protein PilV